MSNYAGGFTSNDENNPWNKAFDLIKEGSTVLDVGCSAGDFGAALIEQKGCLVDGIEPDTGDANIAKMKLRKVFNGFMEDALDNVFKNEKYDHVIFLDVIEHLYRPVDALKQLSKHLNPKGTVIFSIPNMAHASVRIMLLGGDFDYGETGLLDNTHLHFYTKKEIERVFNEAGYVIEKIGYTEATYTPSVLKDELKKIGIANPGEELLEALGEDEARIFQYVGSAKLGKTIPAKRNHYSPNPQGAISSWYEKHDKDVQKEFMRLGKQIELGQEQIKLLSEKLNDDEYLMDRVSLRRHVKHAAKKRINKIKG